MEAKYVATFEVVKEVVWLQKFLIGLGIVPLAISPLVLFCYNSETMTYFKELRNDRKGKRIVKKYHLICEIVLRRDVAVEKIASIENLVDSFMKTLSTKVLDGHRDNLGVKCVSKML